MLNPSAALYEGDLVRLTPVDHDRDAGLVSQWTHNGEFMRMMYLEPVRPRTIEQVRKDFEKIDKDMAERKNLFHFAVRDRSDGHLAGVARLQWVEWRNAVAWVSLGIAETGDRRRGLGWDTLQVLMRFAFRELNLHRLGIQLPEYNVAALRFFEKAGFSREVRRRRAVDRGGRRWDLITLGLLRPEWEARYAHEK